MYMRNMSTIMFMYYDEPMLWGAGKQVEVRVEAQRQPAARRAAGSPNRAWPWAT